MGSFSKKEIRIALGTWGVFCILITSLTGRVLDEMSVSSNTTIDKSDKGLGIAEELIIANTPEPDIPYLLFTKISSQYMMEQIDVFLQDGDLEGLDAYLTEMDNTYLDNEDLGISYKSLIQKYRKDIATSLSILNDLTLENAESHMKDYSTHTTLLIAYLSLPASYKASMPHSSQSLMFPSFDKNDWDNFEFTELELTYDEQVRWLTEINLQRRDEDAFTGVKKILFKYHDIDWIATFVTNSHFLYGIYSIDVANREESPLSPFTAMDIREMKVGLSHAEIDTFLYSVFDDSFHAPDISFDVSVTTDFLQETMLQEVFDMDFSDIDF